MKELQATLNKLAQENTRQIAVVLEGRDTAGKSRISESGMVFDCAIN